MLLFTFLDKLLDDSMDLKFKEDMSTNIDSYKAAMKRIVNGDTRMQVRMLGIRKFFSCPWLICPDQLIRNLK